VELLDTTSAAETSSAANATRPGIKHLFPGAAGPLILRLAVEADCKKVLSHKKIHKYTNELFYGRADHTRYDISPENQLSLDIRIWKANFGKPKFLSGIAPPFFKACLVVGSKTLYLGLFMVYVMNDGFKLRDTWSWACGILLVVWCGAYLLRSYVYRLNIQRCDRTLLTSATLTSVGTISAFVLSVIAASEECEVEGPCEYLMESVVAVYSIAIIIAGCATYFYDILTWDPEMGPLLIVLWKTVVDIANFLKIYLAFTLFFALAFMRLYDGNPAAEADFGDFGVCVQSLLRVFLAGHDFGIDTSGLLHGSATGTLLAYAYLFISIVMLLTVLVAMMTVTFENVAVESKEMTWQRLRARKVLDLMEGPLIPPPFSVVSDIYQLCTKQDETVPEADGQSGDQEDGLAGGQEDDELQSAMVHKLLELWHLKRVAHSDRSAPSKAEVSSIMQNMINVLQEKVQTESYEARQVYNEQKSQNILMNAK